MSRAASTSRSAPSARASTPRASTRASTPRASTNPSKATTGTSIAGTRSSPRQSVSSGQRKQMNTANNSNVAVDKSSSGGSSGSNRKVSTRFSLLRLPKSSPHHNGDLLKSQSMFGGATGGICYENVCSPVRLSHSLSTPKRFKIVKAFKGGICYDNVCPPARLSHS